MINDHIKLRREFLNIILNRKLEGLPCNTASRWLHLGAIEQAVTERYKVSSLPV